MLMPQEFIDNGFTDRLLFIAPKNQKIFCGDLEESPDAEHNCNIKRKWQLQGYP